MLRSRSVAEVAFAELIKEGPAVFARTGSRAAKVTPVDGRHLVRQCLGHKSIGSTMNYVGVTDAQAAKAAQAALMNLY